MGLDEDRARRRSGGSRRASVLGNSWNTMDSGVRLFTRRGRIILVIVALLVISLVLRLAWVQMVKGPELASMASMQRTSVITESAHRGTIVDRNGSQLAYTMEARSLSVLPNRLMDWMEERHNLNPSEVSPPEERLEEIITGLPVMLEELHSDNDTTIEVEEDDLREKLTSDSTY